MSAERIDQPENGIEIVFSAPLSTTQDLKGLIEIPEISSSIFQISENRVFIYFEANTQNKLTLNIHEGVKDCQGKALGTSHTISFSEVSLKPQVEMSTTAAILPDSKKSDYSFQGCQPIRCGFERDPHFREQCIDVYANQFTGLSQ